MGDFGEFVQFVAPYTPLWVLWIFGIGLAIKRWWRHPQMSHLLVAALGLLLAASIGWSILQYLFFMQWRTIPGRMLPVVVDLRNVLPFFQYLYWGINTVAWAILLMALFGRRSLPTWLQGPDGQFLPRDSFRDDRPKQ